MKCTKCMKEIDHQLVLFDGTLVCPLCKKTVVDTDIKFEVTNENEELFVQSEISYLKGIKGPNQQAQYDKAVALASKAAALGHPKAIYKMGYYYDKGFAENDRSSQYKTMIAYQYYSCLAYNKEKVIEVEGHLPKYDLERLKYDSANDLLNMLAYFDNDKKNEKYTVRFNYERLKNRYPDIKVPIRSKDSLNKKKKKLTDRILETLVESQKGTKRALYGIYKLTGEEMKELLTKEVEEDNLFRRLMKSKNYLFEYSLDYTENDKFKSISTENQYNRCLEDIEDDLKNPNYLFMFYNEKPNFKTIEKNKVQLVEKAFLNDENSYSLIKDGAQTEYVFFEDDVLWNKKKENSYKNAVDELIRKVLSNSEDKDE